METEKINEKFKKVALVHDYLNIYGGAEKVLQVFREIFPEAPIFVLSAKKTLIDKFFSSAKVYTSFLGRLPLFWQKRKKLFTPFLPVAIESFDLSQYDLVVSSSSAFAKGVLTPPETLHISYIHTPMRFVWDWYFNYLYEKGSVPQNFFSRSLARIGLHYLRMWDKESSLRPDFLIANSLTTQGRIKKYWGRESFVLYPPVEIEKIKQRKKPLAENESKEDYFVVVGNLSPFKKVDLAIEACNKLGKKLLVIGAGKEKKNLQKISGPTIKFMGSLSDEAVYYFVERARAFLMPQVEDFGIAAVEAIALGTPIIAFKSGGATESVKEGISGIFFEKQNVDSLIDAIKRFCEIENQFNRQIMLRSVEKFSKENFKKNFINYLAFQQTQDSK
jgi:glycosyltransferase involved in cell wall biosynthesis